MAAELKGLLRKFYQMVHPDRLSGYPRAQADNLRSFQQLQSMLQRNDRSSGAVEPVSFHVASGEGSTGEPMRQVSCTLRAATLDDDLRYLLRQCGIEPPPTVRRTRAQPSTFAPPRPGAPKPGDADAFTAPPRRRRAGSGMPSWAAMRQPKVLSRESSLSAFLAEHAASARAAHADAARHGAEADTLRRALRERFGVHIELVDRWIPSARARMLGDILAQLEASTELQRAVLRGAHVRVSGSAGEVGGAVDCWGNLTVSAHLVHRKSLMQLADSVDIDDIQRGRSRLVAVRALENSFARALCLAAVSAPLDSTRVADSYASFLSRVTAEARGRGSRAAHLRAWADATFADATAEMRMPARAPAPSPHPEAEGGNGARSRSLWRAVIEPGGVLEEAQPLRLHQARRTVYVPVHASTHAIALFLGTRGATAAAVMAARANELEAAREHIGAARLDADAALSDEQVHSACAKLRAIEPREATRKMCAGLVCELTLGFAAQEDGTIKLRWDFDS